MTLNSLKAAATGQLRNRRRKALASIKPAEPAEEQPTSALQEKKKKKYQSPAQRRCPHSQEYKDRRGRCREPPGQSPLGRRREHGGQQELSASSLPRP